MRTLIKQPIVLALAAAIAVLIALIASKGGNSTNKVAANERASSTTQVGGSGTTIAGGDAGPSAVPTGRTLPTKAVKGAPTPSLDSDQAPVPLTVAASNTTGLSDGDAVTVHAEAKNGSALYGFEIFLCKSDATYQLDSDIRPTETGKCASKPLSAASDKHLEVPAAPPYKSADGTFRVGVGSDTYRTQAGETVTIRCGPHDPCALVLKLQYPNASAYQAIPLTFK